MVRKFWRAVVVATALSFAIPFAGSAQEPPSSPREAEEEDDTPRQADRDQATHEIFGLDTHPYIAFEFARLSEVGDWSPGLTGGVEADLDPLWIAVCYTMHDILSEKDVVPWDGTFAVKLGLYQGGVGTLASLPTYAHAAIVLARPSGPDEWSPGFEVGAETDLRPLYIGLTYTLQDILADEEDEVYPWDGTFAVAVGAYW